MRAALVHDLTPPAADSTEAVRRGEGLFSLVLLVAGLATLAALSIYAPRAIQRWFGGLPVEEPLDLLLLFAAAILAMALHEAGHLLVALAAGFELLGITLGPVQGQFLHGKWKISLQKRLFTGSVSAVPRSLRFWRPAMLMVVAGGPLATLLCMIVAAQMPVPSHPAAFLQSAFVQISALLFLLGFIPTPPNARTANDMRLFIDLARRNAGSDDLELNVLLAQQLIEGIPAQNYPPELMRRMAAWRGRPETQLSCALALTRWAIASDDLELAESWDARAMSLLPLCSERGRNAALVSSACFDIIFRNDYEAAGNKLNRVDFNALFPRTLEYRARAAHQLAFGRLHRVGGLVIRAQYAIPRGVACYELDRQLLAAIHMRALRADTRSVARGEMARGQAG